MTTPASAVIMPFIHGALGISIMQGTSAALLDKLQEKPEVETETDFVGAFGAPAYVVGIVSVGTGADVDTVGNDVEHRSVVVVAVLAGS